MERKRLFIDKTFEVWRKKNNIQQQVPARYDPKVIDWRATIFAPGRFYCYILNFVTYEIESVHPNIRKVLDFDAEEFTVEKLFSILHPEDLKRFHEKENAACEFLFNFLTPDLITDYKVVYVNRIQRSDGKYIKVLHQATCIQVSGDGKMQSVFCVHTDISHLNIALDHRVSFIGENNPSYYSIDPGNLKFKEIQQYKNLFTKQEIRIIQLIASGKSTSEIADLLFIAESTVKSHRKNILLKSGVKNSTHLIANCLREGII